MKNIKLKFSVENLLCLFVVLCPILDIMSFLFRNEFNINFSPSTFIRPLIPIGVMAYLFIIKDKKFKLKSILVFGIYMIYSFIHIYLFSNLKNLSSYSNEIHEIQYLVNYSFMVLNLFLFVYIFKDKNIEKLRKTVLISSGIYIVSIYIAIITNTSSYTYLEEQMGFKGWFESGNSICSILLLSMFIYLPLIKDKKYKIITSIIVIITGIFLTTIVGTRVGLFGFVLVISIFISTEIFKNLILNRKLNKKILVIGITSIAIIFSVVAIFGSNTLQRRQHLQDIQNDIVDISLNSKSHITGDLLNIKQKIDSNNIEEGYLSDEQKQSIINLYNIANNLNISNNDQRMQQLIYHISLVKNQSNPILLLFGNGYMTHFRELVFEMEVLAILINFGLVGFLLYLAPFVGIALFSLNKVIKEKKKYNAEYTRIFCGLGFGFALSFFSGYTFFNQSSAMMIVLISTFLINNLFSEEKIKNNDENKLLNKAGDKNEKNLIWNN